MAIGLTAATIERFLYTFLKHAKENAFCYTQLVLLRSFVGTGAVSKKGRAARLRDGRWIDKPFFL